VIPSELIHPSPGLQQHDPPESIPVLPTLAKEKEKSPLDPIFEVAFEPIPPTVKPLDPVSIQPILATPLPVDRVNSALPYWPTN
jgi:hypothetical protein